MGDLSLKFRPELHDHVVVHEGNLLAINTLFEGKPVLTEQGGHRQLGHDFDEGLADTDSLPAKERREAESATLLTGRRQVVLALWVEALWDEAFRLLPLQRMILHAPHVDDDWIAFSNAQLASLKSLTHTYG